jgi:flagella basal body P-ring formation protein FlgA
VASVAGAQGLAGSRYPISGAHIAKALSLVGVSVEASQVHFPSNLSATVESPEMEIVTATPIGERQVRLEVRCATAAECLPFFAAVDVRNATLISAELQSHSAATAAASHQTRLRVGSHAVLIIKDGHLNIHLQVLAIDSGVIGQQVRVCTLDRKRVFQARVTGGATLTGVLQ